VAVRSDVHGTCQGHGVRRDLDGPPSGTSIEWLSSPDLPSDLHKREKGHLGGVLDW
jgi:hypothetical protein